MHNFSIFDLAGLAAVTWMLVRVLGPIATAFAKRLEPPPPFLHALILGTVETLAALLFLVPRTMRVGAVALLAIFALAFAVHPLGGNWHLASLVYAAGVLFVHIHGVRAFRWQAAT